MGCPYGGVSKYGPQKDFGYGQESFQLESPTEMVGQVVEGPQQTVMGRGAPVASSM